jgi:hypothetical protein
LVGTRYVWTLWAVRVQHELCQSRRHRSLRIGWRETFFSKSSNEVLDGYNVVVLDTADSFDAEQHSHSGETDTLHLVMNQISNRRKKSTEDGVAPFGIKKQSDCVDSTGTYSRGRSIRCMFSKNIWDYSAIQ